MTLETFYFVCFLVGFLMSLITFLTGSVHVHTPHGVHFHGAHHHGQMSWFNFGTLTAFLAWFGGTGYLLTRYSDVWVLLGLLISGLSGIGGAALVFWFVFKVLLKHEQDLDPADYNMIGVLGHVSAAIRAGGTGEMIFSQAGARRAAAIRNDDGRALVKGEEVVVLRYEKGIAYVRPFEQLTEPRLQGSGH